MKKQYWYFIGGFIAGHILHHFLNRSSNSYSNIVDPTFYSTKYGVPKASIVDPTFKRAGMKMMSNKNKTVDPTIW